MIEVNKDEEGWQTTEVWRWQIFPLFFRWTYVNCRSSRHDIFPEAVMKGAKYTKISVVGIHAFSKNKKKKKRKKGGWSQSWKPWKMF